MGLSDSVVRLIRTYVPLAMGTLIANVPGLADVINTDVLVLAVIGAYYGLAAFLEQRVHPAFGWLLGTPKNN